jgi:twitching motility protein PilT
MSSSPLKAVPKETAIMGTIAVEQATTTQSPAQKAQATASPNTSITNANKPTMKYLLHALVKHGASDLHIKSNRPPMYRINGKLVAAKMGDLATDVVKEILFSVLTTKLMGEFERNLQVDFSFAVEGMGRFRANVYMQRGTPAGVIRMIPLTVPSLEQLGLPSVLKELALKKRGLILVTGPTGSGKSTTMAAILNHINEHRHAHIVTVEDPIEFIYRDQKSSICQRELGTDANTMMDALVGALRQDPDVITIGEMRDIKTVETALTAAETGHLVVSTLHTHDAKSSIDRIIDVFPSDAHNQVRIQMSSSLLAVISQKLVPRADREGRVPVCEILIKSPTIENLILKGELDKIPEAISNSTTYYKMQTFNQALEKLVMSGTITNEDAIFASNSPEDLKMRLSGFRREDGQ